MTMFGNQNSGGRGLNLRLIIAAVIAIGAIISYFAKTSINPVTGEKQRIGMSVDQEKQMGLAAAPEMANQMGGAADPQHDRDAAKVAEIGAKLSQRSDAARSQYADNFHYYLLNDPQTINAFALPGGQVFITRGLYDKLENEGELAGVLGHETGHVVARHSAEQMAKGQLGQMLVTAVAVGASDDRGHGQMAAMAAQMANQMAMLHYSRDDESQADNLGLKYMTEAGFHPRGMAGVMRILTEASKGNRQPEFLSSHPFPEHRAEVIDAYLKEHAGELQNASLTDGAPLR